MALITCEHVCLGYDGQTVLRDVNFTVSRGDLLCVVGENGSGKSTLIKGLLGLKAPEQGSITLGDGLVRNEIGYLPQQTQLQRDFPASVAEVVRSGCINQMHGRPFYSRADRARAQENMERMGIEDLAHHSYQALSGGQQQRVLLARALCAADRLLILDEATAGLDPMARDEVLDALRDFVAVEDAQGNPVNGILMSSHITSDLDKIADTVLCIDAGRPVFNIAKDEVCDLMGVARCRAAELEQIARSGVIAPGAMRIMRQDYGIDLLVPDRFAFAESFPSIPCDRMGIDEYMVLMIKGERYC